MPTLDKMEETDTNSVILFGSPFTGKTTLAGKLAEHFKIIYIDLENGRRALAKLPMELKKNITVIKLPDTPSFPIAIETCPKLMKGPVDVCDAHGKVGCALCKKAEMSEAKEQTVKLDGTATTDVRSKYFTHVDLNSLGPDHIVVFDSATQLTASALANITKNQPDTYKLQLDDWGALSHLMTKFFSYIQNAPFNIIVISHVSESEQEDGKMMLTPVAGSSTFSANVAKFFDHSVYAEIKNKTHRFASSTDYNTRIKTGSRTDVRLEDNPDATLLSIFKPELVPEEQRAADKKKVLGTSSSVSAGSASSSKLLENLKNRSKPQL